MGRHTEAASAGFRENHSRSSTISKSAGNPNSQHDNHIWSVQGDSQGFLWFGTERGLNRLDRKTGQITVYRHDPKNTHSLSNGSVICNSRRPGQGVMGCDIWRRPQPL